MIKMGFSKLTCFYRKYDDILNITLLIILPLLVFYNSLNIFYSDSDDLNSTVHSQRNIAETFITNTSGGTDGGNYRPIEVISHQLDKYFYGDLNPVGRHVTNLIVHILNVLLIYQFCWLLTKRKIIGLAAGLIFAIYFTNGIGSSPVVWISGRLDSFVTLFYLLTLILFIKSLERDSDLIYYISFISFIFALLTKEMAVTLPLLIFLFSILFPIQKKGKGIFDSEHFYRLLLIIGLFGIAFIFLGLIADPGFLSNFLSRDGILQNPTISKINYDRNVLLLSGGTVLISVIVTFISVKFSKRLRSFILSQRYSIPYFLILFFYIAARYLLLGGFGGQYMTSRGENLFLQLGLDAYIRDIYALSAFIWPVDSDFLNSLFAFQLKNRFLFNIITILALAFLFLLLIRVFKSRSKAFIFSFLWIFITLIPLHNILIVHGNFQLRYLYLPLAGFAIFLSIIIYKFTQTKKIPYHLAKVLAVICFICALTVNSIMIIDNNEQLKDRGEKMKKFILDLKKEPKISPNMKIHFITFPTSIIGDYSKEYDYEHEILRSSILYYIKDPRDRFKDKLSMRMNNILNFCYDTEDYKNQYIFDFILFASDSENNGIRTRWIDERNLIIDGISLKNFSVFTKENISLKRHSTANQKPILQLLSAEGEKKETENSIIEVKKIDKKTNTAELKITLKENTYKPGNENIFFLFNHGHIDKIKGFSKKLETL